MNTETPRVWVFQHGALQRAAGVYRSVSDQPNWVVRIALTVFLLILFVPIVLLLLLAIAAGVAVVVVLGGIAWLAHRVRSLMPRGDGRSNVRIVQRSDP